jgi:hypothetical protein
MDGNGTPRRLRGRLGRCSTLAAGGAATILTLGAAAGSATASAHPEAVTNFNGSLSSVTAVSATDAWAVGGNAATRNMILHWDGTSWTKAAIPKTHLGSLSGVSASSADDAWAVGAYSNSGAEKTLVLHWDGTNWTKAASPSPGQSPVNDDLNGVSAPSPSDVWAVGTYSRSGKFAALVLHWNGSTWAQIPVPHAAVTGELISVDALSATDVWAVSGTDVLHWNGTRWSVRPGSAGGLLTGVAALSATDAWVVGAASGKTLVLHCSGTGCPQVASPNPGGTSSASFNHLDSVTALSPTDAWAVGAYGHFNGSTIGKTLVLHWDGTSWAHVASPTVAKSSALYSVTASSASQAWAVGQWGTRTVPGGALILRWNGTSWTQS